jgi:hypothetical protein
VRHFASPISGVRHTRQISAEHGAN